MICGLCNVRVEVVVIFREICKATIEQMQSSQRTLSTSQSTCEIGRPSTSSGIGRPSTSSGSSMATSMAIFSPSAPMASSTLRPSCIVRAHSTAPTEYGICAIAEGVNCPIDAVAVEGEEVPENIPTPSPSAGPMYVFLGKM